MGHTQGTVISCDKRAMVQGPNVAAGLTLETKTCGAERPVCREACADTIWVFSPPVTARTEQSPAAGGARTLGLRYTLQTHRLIQHLL